MLFNSLDFAFFFPIVFIIYWILSRNLKLRNVFLLLTSYIFYGWWDWRFLGLILFSSILDFIIGKAIYKEDNHNKKKLFLFISLFANLGLLGFFKYFNFFIISFVDAFSFFGKELELNTLSIILPVGISFYTFQTLSYTIDIYKGKLKPTNNVIDFFTFVAFFPQLVAGPIERASHLLPQFSKKLKFDYSLVKSGLLLMCWGLFKKMVVADRVAIIVNEVFNNTQDYTSASYTIATFLFAFQIYCDFSGYSDIAIGLARTMGFDLMKNFRTPYFSKSITEFWRRWHISLSTWFRDYVYIPLGGSRKGQFKLYLNLFLVFLVSGVWHGAAWTYVIWGAIHGVVIVIEKFSDKFRTNVFSKIGFKRPTFGNKVFFVFITFSIVCISWVFFRANSLEDALNVFLEICNINNYTWNFENPEIDLFELKKSLFFIATMLIIEILHNRINLHSFLNKQGIIFRWTVYLTAILVLLIFGIYGNYDDSQFIYFQF
ncbi:MBOAT family O-acyltransferase [Gaetbulibacter saemankumensis]|uniref:MBOAT family O-acyltransferase n=1 Tax=Gaetbulibacter saemankumensis TaxID=311208 RepID=UPI0004149A97|nr:MBOAT family O-acyltransferase [Gaetbulibacter saemankumensis]